MKVVEFKKRQVQEEKGTTATQMQIYLEDILRERDRFGKGNLAKGVRAWRTRH